MAFALQLLLMQTDVNGTWSTATSTPPIIDELTPPLAIATPNPLRTDSTNCDCTDYLGCPGHLLFEVCPEPSWAQGPPTEVCQG